MSETGQCATFSCDAVGLLITVLQLGQFLPQHYEMAVDKSVVGVSPWLLFFGSLYTFLAALDTILIGAGGAFTCGVGAYRCFINDQPLLQMCGSAFLSTSMWYWFLKYHHEDPDVADTSEHRLTHAFFHGNITARQFYNALVALSTTFSVVACALVYTYGSGSEPVLFFAYICGTLAAVLNALMWMPQIVVTYQFGHKGALSFGWVLASVVMDVAYSVYLATMGMHWSVWINNVPDGIQTGALLVMLLLFERRDRLQGMDEYGNVVGHDGVLDADMASPLLKEAKNSEKNYV